MQAQRYPPLTLGRDYEAVDSRRYFEAGTRVIDHDVRGIVGIDEHIESSAIIELHDVVEHSGCHSVVRVLAETLTGTSRFLLEIQDFDFSVPCITSSG
jgi:hypothetical protein